MPVAVSTPPNLSLPHPAAPTGAAIWDGEGFVLGGRRERVLAYEVAPSGWTEELTQFHEQTGGSDYFIDVASREHALTEIARCLPRERATLLEIGSSSGFLIAEMRQRFPEHVVVGSDYTAGTLREVARRSPGVPLLQFDLTRCPLPDHFADVSVLLNVLEHIEDDAAAVRHLFRITKPGGAVVLEVPAGKSLHDIYDRVLMHHRRYDMRSLCELLRGAGFTIERRSHLGCFLYPAFYATKRLNQVRYPAHKSVDGQATLAKMIAGAGKSNRWMSLITKVEGAMRPHVYLPFGIRCLVTCRRPG